MKLLLALLLFMQPPVKVKYINSTGWDLTLDFLKTDQQVKILLMDSTGYQSISPAMLKDSMRITWGFYYQEIDPICDTALAPGNYRCTFLLDHNTNGWRTILKREDRP